MSNHRYSIARKNPPPGLADFYAQIPNDKFIQDDTVAGLLKKNVYSDTEQDNLLQAFLWLEEYRLYCGQDEWSMDMEAEICRLGSISDKPGNVFLVPPPQKLDTPLQLQELKNRFTGERAFILGNGRSIRAMNLTPLKNEITFGVNAIFNAGFNPSFYSISNWQIAESIGAKAALQIDAVKIFNHQTRRWLGNDGASIFLNFILAHYYPQFPFFSTDASVRVWTTSAASYICLQLAYYMGFSEVYLIGFDHNVVFAPPRIGERTATQNAEMGFQKARRTFEMDGRTIYNASSGGALEIFERVEYNAIFPNGRPAHTEGRLSVDWLRKWREDSRKRCAAFHIRNTTPRVSFVVPVYNVEKYVHTAVTSVMNQTLADIEIIIVNDGSKDMSMTVVESLAKHDPRIRIINQQNQGLGPARNTGLKAAAAPYIIFIDSDDFVDPDMTRLLLEKAEAENLDIVNGGFSRFWSDGSDFTNSTEISLLSDPLEAARGMLLFQHSNSAWARLYRKKLFTDNMITYPAIYYEDIPVTYRLYLASERVGSINKPFYFWRIRKGSITETLTQTHVRDTFTFINMRKQFLRGNETLWKDLGKDFRAGVWKIVYGMIQRRNTKGDYELNKAIMSLIIENKLHTPYYTQEIKDKRIRAAVKRVLGEILDG